MSENKEIITLFAKTNFRNREVPFGIKTDDRRRHMYLIGKTGMGKTTLMENMVIQDIRNGHGVAFLDPHGDSVQRILDSIPSSRVNDVVYFNPADMEYPLAFNILEAVDPKYKHLVASGLMGVFTKIWANLWSARMEYILNNTILALLDSPGNTLLGITRMYVDKKYRKKIVDNIKDPMVRAFWVDEFANYNEKYRTEAIAPIQNKVGQFLSSGIIRNIVGQSKSTIDLREIMDKRKILIMDLSKGKVGEDNSALLGAMIVTKLQLAAMSRTDIEEKERKDFYLYVDEFQNFATESFATILSEARKYRLNLIVGHQYIAQLEQDKSTKVRDAIFGNVGTIAVFRIGAADAEYLETEFEPTFTPNDLVNLPKYHIILKLMINGVASEPFSAVTLSPNPEYITGNSEKVIKVSRERYTNPVSEVEEKISRWMGAEFHQDSAQQIGAAEVSQVDAEKQLAAKMPLNRHIEQVLENSQIPAHAEHSVLAPPPKPVMELEAFNLEPEHAEAKISETASENKNASASKYHSHSQQHSRQHGDARTHNSEKDKHRTHGKKEKPHFLPHQNKGKGEHAKKVNPIWETVGNLHSQKRQQEHKQIQETFEKIIDSQIEQPGESYSQVAGGSGDNLQHLNDIGEPINKHDQPIPDSSFAEKTLEFSEAAELASQPETSGSFPATPVTPSASHKTIIRPGETHKIHENPL